MITTGFNSFGVLTSEQPFVIVKMDVIHVLNDIHNNPAFREVGHLMTPQGLVGALFSLPETPYSDSGFTILNRLDPNGSYEMDDPTMFQILCEQVLEEIDRSVFSILSANKLSNTPYFWGWENLSCLQLITHQQTEIQSEIQKLSWERAILERFYDGMPVHRRLPF